MRVILTAMLLVFTYNLYASVSPGDNFLVFSRGVQYGPVKSSVILKWYKEKRLNATDKIVDFNTGNSFVVNDLIENNTEKIPPAGRKITIRPNLKRRYYVIINDNNYGPVPVETIKTWKRENRVLDNDVIIESGTGNKYNVKDLIYNVISEKEPDKYEQLLNLAKANLKDKPVIKKPSVNIETWNTSIGGNSGLLKEIQLFIKEYHPYVTGVIYNNSARFYDSVDLELNIDYKGSSKESIGSYSININTIKLGPGEAKPFRVALPKRNLRGTKWPQDEKKYCSHIKEISVSYSEFME